MVLRTISHGTAYFSQPGKFAHEDCLTYRHLCTTGLRLASRLCLSCKRSLPRLTLMSKSAEAFGGPRYSHRGRLPQACSTVSAFPVATRTTMNFTKRSLTLIISSIPWPSEGSSTTISRPALLRLFIPVSRFWNDSRSRNSQVLFKNFKREASRVGVQRENPA